MAIVKRGQNIYLIRVYMGRDPLTKKRIEINETVHGTLSDARDRETIMKANKISGSLMKSSRMTLNSLLDSYFFSSPHILGEGTLNKYKTYCEYYVRQHLGDYQIDKITSNDIQSLFNLLLDEKKEDDNSNGNGSGGFGLSPSTVKIVRNGLKSAFKYAVDEKLILENPVSKTKLPPVNESSADSLTFEEAKAFVSVKSEFWYGDAFVFQLHTGLRPQELMALIWDDIDFETDTVRIERACKWVKGALTRIGITKTKRSNRTIDLAPEHLELLRRHLEKQQKHIEERKELGQHYGDEKIKEWIKKERPNREHLYTATNLIFPQKDGSVPAIITARNYFKAMLLQAGITRPKLRWYDLRHTHATFLITMGMPYHEIAERMGHKVQTLLTTYAHFIASRRRTASTLFVQQVPTF